MKTTIKICLLALLALLPLMAVAQTAPLTRDQERERLRGTLERYGARDDVSINFRQSDKNPYNFVGVATTGMKNAQSFEVVVGVGESHTISVRVYPRYNGGYMNLNKARDQVGLMRKLLKLSHHNFFYWAADDDSDIYAIFNFTLESGYPDESMGIVLRSVRNNDQFVGELRQFMDGSAPAP